MKAKEIAMINVFCDGGALGNGKVDAQCYGSFAVQVIKFDNSAEIVKHDLRFDLPEMHTNNQAEYGALLRALGYLKMLYVYFIEHKLVFPQVVIHSDSELICHQVLGSCKCNDKDLKPLREQAAQLLDEIGADIKHVGRSQIVPILGH